MRKIQQMKIIKVPWIYSVIVKMPINQHTQPQIIVRMICNLSSQIDLQRQRNNNLQEQINLMSAEVIKHKKCIIALLETNFETMSKLMKELKSEDNSDCEEDESENEN